jgi:hypothetical protein
LEKHPTRRRSLPRCFVLSLFSWSSGGTNMQALPLDVLEKVAIFAGADINDIGPFGQVCRGAFQAASSPHVWQQLAVIKYGEDLATVSEPLYESDWKLLMIDDNKRGALPTLTTPMACNYVKNRHHYYFCCIVQAVKWDRHANEIRVYIDVRGEQDLRHPSQSSITPLRNELNSSPHTFLPTFVQGTFVDRGGTHYARRSLPVVMGTRILHPLPFVSEIAPNHKHFKGYLAFPVNDDVNWPAGDYSFCYANPHVAGGSDYRPVKLFSIARQGDGLAKAFHMNHQTMSPLACYTSRDSPFANDTPEIERLRWEMANPSLFDLVHKE